MIELTEEHPFAKLHTLLIEDLPAMRQNIRMQLGQLGISKVDQATTPDEAIRLVREHAYDLILCDYNLNKATNGQQLLEFFRSQSMVAPSAMFIMVTAESSYALVASAAEFQPDAYLLKPLTATKLEERILRLLEKHGALKPINDRIRQKDFTGAIAACDKVLAVAPKWVTDILKTKGSLLLDLGNIDDARGVYAKALELRDDLVWAQMGVARCDIAAGKYAEAKAMAQAILDKNPQFIAAYDLLAQVAEAQGNEKEVLDALNRSSQIIPSARRSRMVGDAAYRAGDLEQAKAAFDVAIKQTRGSLTAQPSDVLTLAQVHVDAGDAEQALKLLSDVPKAFATSTSFAATQAAVQAQAYVKMGDDNAAAKAFDAAKQLSKAQGIRADAATLALAKAAFAVGQTGEGAEILSQAVKSDHENKAVVSLARKVLADTGNEALTEKLIDSAVNESMSIVAEAEALMRSARLDESLEKLEEALRKLPDNTGILFAAAQLHLLWMSQKGLNRDYVARVNTYLGKLDALMPGNERVAKMYRFLRETLGKVAAKQA
jgi:tetratricopeptide (TPR) repeat protein